MVVADESERLYLPMESLSNRADWSVLGISDIPNTGGIKRENTHPNVILREYFGFAQCRLHDRRIWRPVAQGDMR